jgi:hypothetical protein
MTFGWQTSDEVQKETKIVKNRSSKDVTIIPVFYESFDAEYDNQVGHYYVTNWKSLQGVPSKEKDPDFMNTLLKLFRAHEVKETKEESIINNVHVPEEEYTGNSGMRVPLLVSLAAAAAAVALVGAASRSRRWR